MAYNMYTLKHPVLLAILVGICVYAVMYYVNYPCPKSKNKKINDEKKETNILVALIASLGIWYVMQGYEPAELVENIEVNLVIPDVSSNVEPSISLLGNGIKYPEKLPKLPNVFHAIE